MISEAALEHATVFRVSAAGNGRDLSQYFLDHGVALVGRGAVGDWRTEPDKAVFLNEKAALKVLCRAEVGDVVVMNRGRHVFTVGVVAAPYDHRQEFAN